MFVLLHAKYLAQFLTQSVVEFKCLDLYYKLIYYYLRLCLIITCRENVHIMVLPVAETIEKQLMVVLRDREKDLTEFLGIKMFLAPVSSICDRKY